MAGPCFVVAHAAGGGRHAAWRAGNGTATTSRCGVAVGPGSAEAFLECDDPVCQRCLDLVRKDQGVPLVERDHEALEPAATVETVSLW